MTNVTELGGGQALGQLFPVSGFFLGGRGPVTVGQ